MVTGGSSETDLFLGGGTYYDDRGSGIKSVYASTMNMPGTEMSPGSVAGLFSPYRGDRFQGYGTARHEIGHHLHAELRRLDARINDTYEISEHYNNARRISSELYVNLYKNASFQNTITGFQDIQHRLISESLMYSGIRKSLGSSVLSSSERKRGELFASMLEHASLDYKSGYFGRNYETVRVLGDRLRPDMFGRPRSY